MGFMDQVSPQAVEQAAIQGALAIPALYNIAYFLARASDPRRLGQNYQYGFDNGAILLEPNGTTGFQQQVNITINSDHDYRVYGITGTAFEIDEEGVETWVDHPNVEILFQEKQFEGMQNRAIHWNEWIGDAKFPYYLALQQILPRTSVNRFTLTNLDTERRLRVRITLHGIKVTKESDVFSADAAGLSPMMNNPIGGHAYDSQNMPQYQQPGSPGNPNLGRFGRFSR